MTISICLGGIIINNFKEKAYEILNIAQMIYQINESINANTIFRENIFFIMADGKIFVEKDYEEKDSSYYFEAPDIRGVIIKKSSGNYCITTSVKYANVSNHDLWFAKIRIEKDYNDDIQIMGHWGGSWQKPDYEDENLIENPNPDFTIALDATKNHLTSIYNMLSTNPELSSLYEPKWVKQLKKYNN